MAEATEICKLRLFLKLAAQVEPDQDKDNLGIEPLPDIDFNIRAGNTLVGFATETQVKSAITGGLQTTMDFDDQWTTFETKLKAVAKQFDEFQKSQTTNEWAPEYSTLMKKALRERLRPLRDDLDHHLAHQYGKISKEAASLWKKDAEPFHWFIEFYAVMAAGGFDVIIGNPPYVEYSEIKKMYTIKSYQTEACGNLYAYVVERCFALCSADGRIGCIIPVSSVSTDGYASLQKMLNTRVLHFSSFDDRPSRLFDGLEHIRLTIHIVGATCMAPTHASTRYNKWAAVERSSLFQRLKYVNTVDSLIAGSFPKLTAELEIGICEKLSKQTHQMAHNYSQNGQHRIFFSRKVGYFLQVLDFQPRITNGFGELRPPSEFKQVIFASEAEAKIALCILNSNLFYWFVTVFSDCRHLNKREVDSFPVRLSDLAQGPYSTELCHLAACLMHDLAQNSETRSMRFKHDTLTVQCIIGKLSKPIIDDIDRVLGRFYGFNDDETDYLVNYDIKYRMGRNGKLDEDSVAVGAI